jgi:hypothetical protein
MKWKVLGQHSIFAMNGGYIGGFQNPFLGLPEYLTDFQTLSFFVFLDNLI